MHASIELTVSALIIAAATAIAPLSAYAATMPAPSVPAVSATATAPAGTSVSFTVLAPMVTSTGSGGVLTITRTAGTVTYSIL